MKNKIVLIMLMILMLCACNNTKTVDTNDQEDELESIININGYSIMIDDVYDTNKIGEPNSSYETTNCANLEQNIVYVYDDFEITTHKVEGKERIIDIFLTKTNFKANDGLYLGISSDNAKALFNASDIENKDNGIVIDMSKYLIQIVFENDMAISIEYVKS